MKLLVISDTHDIELSDYSYLRKIAKEYEVEQIIHCGDILLKHVSGELFGGLPVICALVGVEQSTDPAYIKKCPDNWQFTVSEKRFVSLLDGTKAYVGHMRPWDAFMKTEAEFDTILANLRIKFDGLRWVFGGHMHVQVLHQGSLVSLVNGGSFGNAINNTYEFAVIDTVSEDIIFSRILPGKPDKRQEWSLGVISDSLDVSYRDESFWHKLAHELTEHGVKHIIHCGNLALGDIGHEELKDFTVYFAVRPDQLGDFRKLENIPHNWKLISSDKLDEGGVVDITVGDYKYRFYVQLDLGLKFVLKSDLDMNSVATEIRRQHPETEFLLCGFTHQAVYFEGEQVVTINPGDVVTDHSYAIITLPRREILFSRVPYDTLPPL